MHLPALLLALLAALVLGAGSPAQAVPTIVAAGGMARATDVHGDDERDAYVGTGGLILPGTVSHETRVQVASCPGCRWRLSTPCEIPGSGTAFDGQSACLSVVRGCPGGRLLRSWFQQDGQAWREIGLVCVPPAGPVTVADVARAAQAGFERGIPALRPAFQPAHGAVTQLPVVLDSGQSAGTSTWRLELLGRDVTLRATPAWSWQFGDGSGQDTSDPGGRYPHMGVAHAYRQAGRYRITCTSTWSGSFDVDGLGPFPVAEALRQTQVRVIGIGEGRALLTPAPAAPARPPG